MQDSKNNVQLLVELPFDVLPLTTNAHIMITWSKDGIFKPKHVFFLAKIAHSLSSAFQFTPLVEPTIVYKALSILEWL